ncbi:Type III restriction enzyme, res subunit:DEAD/DEAH box helicase, N-terminal [Dehalococcoides mccartyi]|uniref:Type III restriction enzyme, res subunit:DEAD/DEAH box helicase, N-terminal n=1 Tax=Dehalococcoides mccartyi TaxID=61435 RepID=A0A328ENM8_9CHLR|nr:Type III restriction enzyme, res subunit:DEAD/DEAH box helicase, N-terminal [Dehalococcoides mccartyi]
MPSIAIREGVNKSFEITQEHFMEQYGIKARFFVYNSSNLHQLDEFSNGFGINVMIINIQAFATSLKEDGRSKESRIIYSKRDEFGSRKPIDVIKANRPIIILDEPQKMGGNATQNALKNNFNPLFSLNYSATHKTSHNLVYVLDALDAFQKKLVKKIEVKGFEMKNLRGTDKYIYLAEITVAPKNPPQAHLEFEVQLASGTIKRDTQCLGVGDSLYAASGSLEQYKGLSVSDIDPISKTVMFSNGDMLSTGMAAGDVNESDIRRIQIRETILSHFEKEEQLFQSGIKCLSLFFIDEVAKYRQYNENGDELLGEYGQIFEQEYNDALNRNLMLFQIDYQEYLRRIEPSDTHRGYFSIDKQGHITNSTVKRGSEFSDDISAYDLILKNKERLLSFDEPTRFIFSHSALREGWDNPNIFQICTLKHSDNATTKRQEVGRGLRLCVNQMGDRQDVDACGETVVHDVNKLTVIASESYTGFVSDLQRKIREDSYERPTKASVDYFAQKTIKIGETTHTVTVAEATAIYNYLIRNEYVDDNGTVTDTYHSAVESGSLAPLKAELEPLTNGIHALVQGIFDPSVLEGMIENGHDTKVKENPLNDNFFKQEFQDLWKRINKRYAYTVEFDSPELIEKSIGVLNANLNVSTLRYNLVKGEQMDDNEFVVRETASPELVHTTTSSVEYDLIGKIADQATLTRKSVVHILKGINPQKRAMFGQNPEEFIQHVVAEINKQKASIIVEHISYRPSAEEPYTQNIFNMSKSSQEYAKAYHAKKAIQDYVFTDGTAEESIEQKFAKDVEAADEVVVYAKLPAGKNGFYIPTPVGNYSPDWAIAFKKGTVKHIFFIAETKGSMQSTQFGKILRKDDFEKAKITCAKKLFNEISTGGVKYHDVDSYETLLNIMQAL